MISNKFLSKQMMKLEQNYGKDRFKITQQMFDLWSDMFKDYDEEGLRVSVDEYIQTSEYPPTIGSIAKIYRAKDNYRKEMASFLKSKYLWVCRWIEQKPTQEEFSWFCKYVMSYEKDERKSRADEIVRRVIARYNELPEKKTLREWIGNER